MTDALFDWFETIFGASADSLGGALVILAMTTAFAVAGRIVSAVSRGIGLVIDRQRRRREILTDIAIYARTYDNNVKLVTSDRALDAVRDAIRADPVRFRAYNAAINDAEVYEEYKEIRRRLSPADMSRLDTFFDRARIFEVYYLKMASDEFEALSAERKLKVVDQLHTLGARLSESHDTLFADITRLKRLAQKIDLDKLLPPPAHGNGTGEPGESSDDGGQGPRSHVNSS